MSDPGTEGCPTHIQEESTRNRPTSLTIDSTILREMREHLRAALPHEGCGLLATVDGGNGVRRAVTFYPGTNIDRSPTRFTMDPAEVTRAFADMEARGWALGAIVHSHPRTPPLPSAVDRREAFYPDALSLIVSFGAEPPLMRAWILTAETPSEIELRTIDP